MLKVSHVNLKWEFTGSLDTTGELRDQRELSRSRMSMVGVRTQFKKSDSRYLV